MKRSLLVAILILVGIMTILSLCVIVVIHKNFPEYNQIVPAITYVSLFFTLFGSVTLSTLDKKKGDAKGYSQTFLGLKVIKLFAAVAGFIFYVFFNKEMLFPFTIVFVIFYVIYTVYEAIILTKLK